MSSGPPENLNDFQRGRGRTCVHACKVRDGRQIPNLILPMSEFLTWAVIRSLIKNMFCLCMCFCVVCAYVCTCEIPGEGVGSPGAGVRRGYELQVLVLGTRVLCKSSKYS